jgi:anti-sigma factor RsiW
MSAATCDKALLLQAEFDGELDAAEAAELARHRADCPECRANWATLVAADEAMRGASRHRAPVELRRSLAAQIGSAPVGVPRRWSYRWREAASFAVGAALAAAIVLAVLPQRQEGIVGSLVDDHVRALQPGHLTDVLSTDQHTVKPWFDGRLDFAPPVKNLAAQGFPLIGGRLDYLRGHPVAALAYSRGKHLIDLFVWPEANGPVAPASASRDGYNVIHWTADGMSLSAVSDVERDQLEAFVREWQHAP